MKRLLWFCALGTLWLTVPAPARAGGYPDPGMGDLPPFITVVGTHLEGGVPVADPAGAFTVHVRDLAQNPLPNVPVTVDVSLATDIVLCTMPIPGQTVDCTAKTVLAVTDAQGAATFTIVGAARNSGAVGGVAAPGAGLDAIRVRVDVGAGPVLFGTMSAAVLDQNGAVGGNGVNALDLAYFSDDLASAALTATYRARSDYNYDEANSGADLASYLDHLGAAVLGTGSGLGCPGAAYCP